MYSIRKQKKNMKKITYLLLLAAITVLVSCSQNEILTTENEQAKPVTFRLTTDKVVTRATPNAPTRYKVEVYKKDNLETPHVQTTGADGNLSVTLLADDYTCLFWADYGDLYYNIGDLKNVAVAKDFSTDPNLLAYCLKQDITVVDAGIVQNIELKHAVAALNLIDTKGVPAGVIAVNLPKYSGFNVLTGNVTGDKSNPTENLSISATTGETTLATHYLFAPISEAEVVEVKFRWEGEDEKTVPNVPLQANYQTVIKGAFSSAQLHSFTVTADDTWDNNINIGADGNDLPLTIGSKYRKNDVEVGTVIWIDESNRKALVMVGYDLKTERDMASAKAFATEKGGRLPTEAEFPAFYPILKDEAYKEKLGGTVVDDFKVFDFILFGEGGGYYKGTTPWSSDYATRTDARVIAVMGVAW